MPEKGNKVENWDESYRHLHTTYSETIDNAGNLANRMQYEFVHEDIERFLPADRPVRVLECGCGGARTSLYLARRGLDVTCSDYAPEALRLAMDNFTAWNAKGSFLADDLLHSKIPPESFDCVMSFGLLEHFEDLKPILASTTRLVRCGGIQVHCIIPKKFSTQTLKDLMLFPFRFARNVLRGRFKDIVRVSFRDFPHYENAFTSKEYCQAFEREGNVILRCEAGGVLYPFLALPWGIGNPVIRTFPTAFASLIRMADRTESPLLHRIAPTIYIVCRKPDRAARES